MLLLAGQLNGWVRTVIDLMSHVTHVERLRTDVQVNQLHHVTSELNVDVRTTWHAVMLRGLM